MQHFPFSKRPDLLVFTCVHIMDGEKNVKFVTHHFEDNNWQFLCGGQHIDTDAVIVSVGELCKADPSLEKISDLPVGHCAERKSIKSKWIISKIPGEPQYPDSMLESV